MVLAALRERFTTLRCLSVKTSLVRSMCTPTAQWRRATESILAEVSPSQQEAVQMWLNRRCNGAPPANLSERAYQLARELPPRLPENARKCCITRSETNACKRAAASRVVEKNRCKVRVNGDLLLSRARACVSTPKDVCSVALALLVLTGRRTCEVLNGTSSVRECGRHAIAFTGQAKRRGGARPYCIPVLEEASIVVRAWAWLHNACGNVARSNGETSRRYQSALRRALLKDAAMAQAMHVHALRGLYVRFVLNLFEWSEASDAYVAMRILGHASLQESLAYTVFDVGESSTPHLGRPLACMTDLAVERGEERGAEA